MAYDDLMGLDMYDDGMEAFYSPEMLKEQMMAAGSSAAAILLATWLLPKVAKMDAVQKLEEPNRHRLAAVLGIVGGMVGSRLLWDRNRDASMAVLGGVSGLGLAQLVDSYFAKNLIGGDAPAYPLGSFANADDGLYGSDDDYSTMAGYGSGAPGDWGQGYGMSGSDEALLAGYGGSALAALESTGVRASRGAFGQFHGTVVNPEQLMGGLDAAVVAGETLGEQYTGYLS
jgi:hypothetical protein